MNEQNKPTLAIVIPCYNEEEALPVTASCLSALITRLIGEQTISPESTLLFIDDGSVDATWSLIEQYHAQNPAVFSGIKLRANCGHQNALLCGLLFIKDHADITISIDADLQDDIGAIDDMLKLYRNGAEIVCGVRSRGKQTVSSKEPARIFFTVLCACWALISLKTTPIFA